MEPIEKRLLEKTRGLGGFTLDLKTLKPVTEGFAVGGIKGFACEQPVSEEVVGTKLRMLLMAAKALSFRGNDRIAIGGWLDKETNIYYYDIVKIYKNGDRAYRTAEETGEIAIFNLNENKEIRVEIKGEE